MADKGVKISTIDPASVADDILVLREGSAVRQSVANLSTQLAGSGAVATRLSRAEIMSGYGAVYAVARADLANVESPVDKQGAWVLTTTEDGEKGIWSYSTSEGDWERIADLPISMALLTDVGGTANAITANTLTSPEPSDIRGLLLVPLYDNDDAVTLELDEEDPVPLLLPGGAELTEGALAANVPTVILSDGANLRIMFLSDVVGQVEALRNEISDLKDAIEAAAAAAGASANASYDFDVLTDVAVATIPSVIQAIRVRGLLTIDDGLGGIYAKSASEPVSNSKVQSVDGAWSSRVGFIESERTDDFTVTYADVGSTISDANRCAYGQSLFWGQRSRRRGGRGLLDGPLWSGDRRRVCHARQALER